MHLLLIIVHVDRRDCEFSFSGLKTAANMIITEIDSAGVCILASDAEYVLPLTVTGLFLVQRMGTAECPLPTAKTWRHPSKKQCFITSWLGRTGASSFPAPTGPTSNTW